MKVEQMQRHSGEGGQERELANKARVSHSNALVPIGPSSAVPIPERLLRAGSVQKSNPRMALAATDKVIARPCRRGEGAAEEEE